VALPFFRRNKDKSSSPAHKPGGTSAAEKESHETLLTMDMGGGSGIVVEENTGAPQSPVDEAAILYASGQNEMAESMLKEVLATGDRRAWHMLFDLYAIQNREKDFEQLAMEYAMRFESSPPVWQKIGGSGSSKAQPALSAASLELPGLLDKKATEALRESIATTDKKATLRIDFSRIEMVDESGADDCTQILSAARKAKRKLLSSKPSSKPKTLLYKCNSRSCRSSKASWRSRRRSSKLMPQPRPMSWSSRKSSCRLTLPIRPTSWKLTKNVTASGWALTSQEADNRLLPKTKGKVPVTNDLRLRTRIARKITHRHEQLRR